MALFLPLWAVGVLTRRNFLSGEARSGSLYVFEALVRSAALVDCVRMETSVLASTILVVDDNAGVRKMLTDILGCVGYQTIPAASGEKALELIAAAPPDVVLLDLDMPGINGRGVARELQVRGVDIPIVVLSAAEDAREVANAIHARAYLSKPFELQTILTLLEDVCPSPVEEDTLIA